MTRRPTMNMTATKAATLANVTPTGTASAERLAAETASPFKMPAMGGSRTRVSTIAMSSTMSHPTAMRPRSVSIRRRSCSARNSTTVLATESAKPKTTPAPVGQPSINARPTPRSVATAICATAPGIAIARTDSRSLSEKCNPTPNISRMTPISASSFASF